MPADEPRFTDEEVEEIFSRAVDRQEEGREPAGSRAAGEVEGGGTSLSELRVIGSQAGIHPRHVERAAAEVARRRAGTGGVGRTEVSAERRLPVPAEALSEGDWEAVVAELRTTYGRHGSAARFGAVREWHSGGEVPVTVRVEPAEGGLYLAVRRDVESRRKQPLIVGGILGLVTLLLAGLFLVGDFATPAGRLLQLLLGAMLAVGGGGFLLERFWERREADRLEGVADRIELLLRDRVE